VFDECYLLPATNPEYMEGFGEGWAFTLELYDQSSINQPHILDQLLGSPVCNEEGAFDRYVNRFVKILL